MMKKTCLSELFLEQVERHPHKVAVICNDTAITYIEMAERSINLARYLKQIGINDEACIGLYFEPSIDLIISVWGIILSENSYLPLAPEYPDERLRFMINHSNTKFIITQEKIKAELERIAPVGVKIIILEDVRNFFLKESIQNYQLQNFVSPSRLAYIIYTSGSTGEPKGVVIENEAIVNQMKWLKSEYGIDNSKTILYKTPISFDAAQWEILSLACGSKIVIGGSGIHRDPNRIIEEINAHNVTTLQCVPTLLQALIHSDNFHSCTSLTQLFCGGEALSKKLAIQFFKTLPNCHLINLYGPTECTINASSYRVYPSKVDDYSDIIPVGFPVSNTQFYILDEKLSPVTNDEIGELYIGGIQLARGYINRPDITKERFLYSTHIHNKYSRIYKTGDKALWNPDGSVQFIGRADNQVKLGGYRIELDEIRIAIERHDWVKHAVILVKENPISKTNNLIAFIELDSKEAALMDQGNHGSHHQSKKNKIQLKAQLSNLGCRNITDVKEDAIIQLPCKEATTEQHRFVFARKTYRFYEGGPFDREKVMNLLKKNKIITNPKNLKNVQLNELGEILRYFGQFKSEKRLLPKYSYASPGALYATQMYLEISHVGELSSSIYYYHPVYHQLISIHEIHERRKPQIKIHFIGKKSAIEPIYKNNIQEVLEMEVGHMIGVFEKILPSYGLYIDNGRFTPSIKDNLRCLEEDYYLGTFEIIPYRNPDTEDVVDIYVQSHGDGIHNMSTGIYMYKENRLEKVTDEIVLRKDVIAINQEVYERSRLGIALISRASQPWKEFIVLGKKMQHLQMNELNFGFMSSGYSSKSGSDLPSAVRLKKILEKYGQKIGHSYFFVGGLVSDKQILSEDMNEDIVHMKGPAEMLRDDLVDQLPHYMIPNKIVILDKIPYTPNGKIDSKAVERLGDIHIKTGQREIISPRTRTEKQIFDVWKKIMKMEEVSVDDDFFEIGGNSLTAVALLNKIKEGLACKLPVQILFECPTIEKLAKKINERNSSNTSRLIPLQNKGKKKPIFCWPGLGGYPMNLKLLAQKIGSNQPFYGVQALGINENEKPYKTISEMAEKDIDEIKSKQPKGPYILCGFSFGARVAFETCYQLEKSGNIVKNLILIAPGSPKIWRKYESDNSNNPEFSNRAFVTILFSVFAGTINDPRLNACIEASTDQESFISFICEHFKNLNIDMIERIINIVTLTYEFKYNFSELIKRKIKAPIIILKAVGDDYSFIENERGFSLTPPNIIQLQGDHYGILKEPHIKELVQHLTLLSTKKKREKNNSILRIYPLGRSTYNYSENPKK